MRCTCLPIQVFVAAILFSKLINLQNVANAFMIQTSASNRIPTRILLPLPLSNDDESQLLPTSDESIEISLQDRSEASRPQRKSEKSEQFETSKSPSTQDLMKAMGTSPRRIFVSITSATAIALGANFFGVTSKVLDAIPEAVVETSGLDTYYPRGNFKRVKSGQNGYTFLIPKGWVADTALELAKAQRMAGNLDYSMRRMNGNGMLPDTAFGPPGRLNARGVSQSDTNVSVVVSKIRQGFTLEESLGNPTAAAETLLKVSLAPEGSGRVATLLAACEEIRGVGNVYQFDYTIDRGDKGVPLKAISVIAAKGGDTLITLTVVAPVKDWDENVEYGSNLRKIAESFKLIQ